MPELKASNKKSIPESVLNHALFLGLGQGLSRILGLIRDVAFANLFSRPVTDAWVLAFRMAHFMRRVVGEGALTSSLYRDLTQEKISPQFLSPLIFLFSCLALLLGAFLWGLGHWFFDVPWCSGVSPLVWQMYVGMIPFCGLVLINGVLSAFLLVRQRWWGLSLSAALFNIVILGALWIPAFRNQPQGLAWAVSVGGGVQTLWLCFFLKEFWVKPQSFSFIPLKEQKKWVGEVLIGFFSFGIWPFIALINVFVARKLGDGVVSHLFWVDRLIELPLTLISTSLGTALLPELSLGHLQRKLKDILFLNLWLVIPCSSVLFFFSDLVVGILFDHQHLRASELQSMGWILKAFSILVVVIGVSKILLPFLFYVQQSQYIKLTTLGTIVFHISFLSWVTDHWHLTGFVGLTLLTQILFTLLLSFKILRSFNLFSLSETRWEGSRFIGLSLCYGLSLWVMNQASREWVGVDKMRGLLVLSMAGLLYLIWSYFFRAPELKSILLKFSRRIRSDF